VIPALILTMWAAGLAGAAATVAGWGIVGPGFLWLAGGVTVLVGALGAAAGGAPLGWLATLAALAGMALARRPGWTMGAYGGASLAYLGAAFAMGGRASAATGALLLGGVTGGMILGHWYLVDPRLPRGAMHGLVGAGGVGLLTDVALLAVRGAFQPTVVGWAFLSLAGLTLVLLAGVWAAVRVPSYAGMMAATGLSYLAVLTALASAALGRSLIVLG
jgi:hypothetical protein